MPITRTFSPALLRQIRENRAYSRWDLARLIDASPVTITGIEHGYSGPSVRMLGRLAGALDCPIDAFFQASDDAA